MTKRNGASTVRRLVFSVPLGQFRVLGVGPPNFTCSDPSGAKLFHFAWPNLVPDLVTFELILLSRYFCFF